MIKEALIFVGTEVGKTIVKQLANGLGEVGKDGIKAAGERIINEIKKLPEKLEYKRETDSLPEKIDLFSDDSIFDDQPAFEPQGAIPSYTEVNVSSDAHENDCPGTYKERLDRTPSEQSENGESKAEHPPIQNKQDGLRREGEVETELQETYPPEEGYSIEQEVYLRDKDGNIVKDPVTGEARRIDFVVIKDGEVVDSVEVTSKTADKTSQSAKEERIRDIGGNYIKDSNGNLVEIPANVQTRIERRD